MLKQLAGSAVFRGVFLLGATALLFESYQIPDDKIPDTVLLLTRIVSITIIVVSLLFLTFQYLYLPALHWHQSRRYQWPAVNKSKPDPNQRLIDLAEQQRQAPASHLVITDRIIMGDQLDNKRPLLRVRVCYTNFGVHDLVISQPEGFPYFGQEQSDDYIRDVGGSNNVPAGNSGGTFNLNIYVPAEFLEVVRNEVGSPSGQVTSISLGQVRAKVRGTTEGSPISLWSIGGPREVFRPNR